MRKNSNKLFQRYIWLVDTVYSAGEITRDEIDRRWANLLERIPEGSRFLSSIVSAMKEEKRLLVTYQRFDRPEPHSFLLDLAHLRETYIKDCKEELANYEELN